MNEQESVADPENTDEKDYLYLDDVLRNTKDIGYYLGYNPTISEKTHWFELLKRVAGLSRDFHNGKQRKNNAEYFQGHITPIFRILTDHLTGADADLSILVDALLHEYVEDIPDIEEHLEDMKRVNSLIQLSKYPTLGIEFISACEEYVIQQYGQNWFDIDDLQYLNAIFTRGKKTAQNLSSQYAKSKATLKSEQDIHRQTLNTLRDFLNGEVSRISYTIDGLRDGRYAQIKDELEGIISGIGTDSFPNPDEFVTETLDAIRLLTRYKEKFSYNESNYQLFNLRRKRHGEHYLEVGLQSRVKATIVRLADRIHNSIDMDYDIVAHDYSESGYTRTKPFDQVDVLHNAYKSIVILTHLNMFLGDLRRGKHIKYRKGKFSTTANGDIRDSDLELIIKLRDKLISATTRELYSLGNNLVESGILHGLAVPHFEYMREKSLGKDSAEMTSDLGDTSYHDNITLLADIDEDKSAKRKQELLGNPDRQYIIAQELIIIANNFREDTFYKIKGLGYETTLRVVK